jgi:hypothetical protein
MRGNIHEHPFLRSMATWSVMYPHFASAKLLSASGWDDVQDDGQLSPWTRRQRVIAVRLLDDTLRNESNVHDDPTVGAIQSLLGYEVRASSFSSPKWFLVLVSLTIRDDQILNGGGEKYILLRRFSKGIINKRSQCKDDTWTYFSRFLCLLDETNRLCMASGTARAPPDLGLPSHFQFSFPADLNLFTFGCHSPSEDNSLIYSLTGELYNVLSIAEISGDGPVAQSTYDYVASLWRHTLLEIAIDDNQHTTAQGIKADVRAAPIRLCIFLLASHLLPGPEFPHNQPPSQLASQLRALVDPTCSGLGSETAWDSFPGALGWCCAIGLRFADAGDRTWFVVNFLKLYHPWLLVKWEETSKSMCLVTSAVDKIQPMYM